MVDLLGMPPMAAIVAATSANARAFGWDELVGTLAPGRMADLLVLDADPLRDIRALRDGLQAVYLGGVEVERGPEPPARRRMAHERGFGVSSTILNRERKPPAA
jgi:cytosine/adenosine deaminase-related metal-dependent hydrolase